MKRPVCLLQEPDKWMETVNAVQKREVIFSSSYIGVEQLEVGEIDPPVPVPVEVKEDNWFIGADPGEITVEYLDVVEIFPAVSVQIFIQVVAVRVGRRVGVARQRDRGSNRRGF